jgi:hypothetical protein
VNLGIFSEIFIEFKIAFSIAIFYLFLIFQFKIFINKKVKYSTFVIYFFIAIFLSILLFEFSEINNNNLLNDFPSFIFVIIFYLEVLRYKFNSIKETLKNLSINFYGFLITTSLLFGFKFYLLLSDIETPSFYYLFLTIPISGAVVYFYTKDLAPILKEAKNKQK